MADIANFLNEILVLGERIEVFRGSNSLGQGVFIETKDRYLVWVPDGSDLLRTTHLGDAISVEKVT